LVENIRTLARDGVMLARLARDLPGFLNSPISYEQAVVSVRRRLRQRAERFVELADRRIYPFPRSPYARLLRAAGCELGDIRAMVAADGLEGALRRLAAAGVYVTFDELKGRSEAVRGSQRFWFADVEFDNPATVTHLSTVTGGTRGSPTRVGRSLRDLEALSIDIALALEAHGVRQPEHVFWLTGPAPHFLLYAKLGQRSRAWFYPLERVPARTRAGAAGLSMVGRFWRVSFPPPRALELSESGMLVEWLRGRRGRGGPLCISTTVSGAVRLATAARERGFGLEQICFLVGSEPMTSARLRSIEASGASTIVKYGLMETGLVGMSCGERRAPDDLHLFVDRFALVQRGRAVADSGVTVQAFLVTTLELFAPKVLVNAETGDDGTVMTAECGCSLGAIGLTTHLADVRSFEKLTGEGMTFAKTNVVRILEETLPDRFGGAATDFQLVESEQAGGSARTYLVVSPRLGPIGERKLRAAFLDALSQAGEAEAHMARIWRAAGSPVVMRREPIATPAGKVFPFQVVRGTVGVASSVGDLARSLR
jgi:hypothetical protein